jgi:hypothetical protein
MAELAATMAALGCDELVLYPCSNDTTQMNLLAEVISGPGRRLPTPGTKFTGQRRQSPDPARQDGPVT